MKLLCTGDLHIGRHSTRVPAAAPMRALPTAACWEATVDLAVRESVDALLLGGDVVDRANRYFEAFGPLERGLARLAEAGIPVAAVAGNHDFDVLGELADGLASGAAATFHLVGRNGRWERRRIETRAGPLDVVGWSFPRERHPDDPLSVSDDDGVFQPAGDPADVPVVGMLHCDVDQTGSPYAPVPLASLRVRPVAFWCLGHVHRPVRHAHPGTAPVLYPGSPQALDPGEPGVHGPWIVELGGGEDGVRPSFRQVPLSPIRYETLDVDVSGAEDRGALRNLVTAAVGDALDDVVAADCGPLRILSCRVRLTGRTALHGLAGERLAGLVGDLERTRGDVMVAVERIVLDTRPAVDLVALAGGSGPPATLAALVLALDSVGGAGSGGVGEAAAEVSGDVSAETPGDVSAEIPPDVSAETPSETRGNVSAETPVDVSAETPAAPPPLQALLTEAAEAAAGVHRARPYAGLTDDAGESGAGESRAAEAEVVAVAGIVRRQALLLLDELLAQKEAPRG